MDWKDPDYVAVLEQRLARLNKMRDNPERLPSLRAYYKANPIQFIDDWGNTLDPRSAGTKQPVFVPFILFPRQREWLEFTLQNWKDGEFGITEKSRDVGISWLCVSLSCTLCLFHENLAIGFGSQQQDKVDLLGDPSCLFYKARVFISYLPREFRGAWDKKIHAPHMRLLFPDTNSSIIGECGDNIGRGGRTAIYFVDEAAFIEHPLLVDQSLSATTNCRFDVSSVNGSANPFAAKARGGKYRKFTFHWRDDPRKDDAWYAKINERYDPVTVAKEYDINYAASVEGVVIPSAWVQAAIGACRKLGIEPTGAKFAGLDVADEGKDKNALAGRHGVHLNRMKSWSGKGGSIYQTVVKAFNLLDEWGHESVDYDADGLGAGVRGDAQNINAERERVPLNRIRDEPFRGSGAVWRPEAQMVSKRLNKDYFLNLKAQSWWALRLRFQATYRWIVEGIACDPDDIISIDESLPELATVIMELSQPTWTQNATGKIVIDKQPDETPSPNTADAVMICYHPATRRFEMWKKLGQ